MSRPLAIDLFCGLFGWGEALADAGWEVVGFDIEDMRGQFGFERLPHCQLVIQDVCTLCGSQFKDAGLIVASPPCQQFSYMAMPWSRAKAKAAAIEADASGAARAKLTELFDACFRIQREACEAASHHIPLIVENVCGAQKWVGRAKYHFGSYYLWGDVPALMPMTVGQPKFKGGDQNIARASGGHQWNTEFKVPGFRFDGSGRSFQSASVEGLKGVPHLTAGHWTNPAAHEGTKNGNDWFGAGENCSLQRRAGSKSSARKAASAMIAKIPQPLAHHIATTFFPRQIAAAGA